MALSTLTTKGQVTIPQYVRDSLHLHAGDKIEFIENNNNEFVLRPINKKASEVSGLLNRYKKKEVISIEEMKEAFGKQVKKRKLKNAVDTHSLVRFLIYDDDWPVAGVNKLFASAEQDKESLFVSLLVVLELIRVLQSVYAVERKDIILALDQLLQMPVLEFEEYTLLSQILISDEKFS